VSETKPSRLDWIDAVKGLALVWVFFNHAVERILGCAYFCNPGPGWPPLHERVGQLLPLEGHGLWGIPLNLFRYLGWTGEQGVQLFLIASGFGLTWGMLQRGVGPTFPLKEYFTKRVLRLYPMWWGAHAVILVLWVLGGPYVGKGFFLSALGVRCIPMTYYAYCESWWFIGLLIQLYILFPLLWNLMCRWGGARLLIVTLVACVAARALGIYSFRNYMDAWFRGAVFITRLPEFVLGMLLASMLQRAPEETDRRLRSGRHLALSLVLYLAGTVLGVFWLGMTLSPFLLGAGAIGLLYPLCSGTGFLGGKAFRWIGIHSYSLYLVHHPILKTLVPDVPATLTAGVFVRLLATVPVIVVAAMALEATVSRAEHLITGWYRRGGVPGVAWRAAAIVAPIALLLVGLDRLSRRLDPMEIQGWGERPSLQPDDRYGWTLRPSQTTRLRWMDYDYRVAANALGFPGPDVAPARPPGGLRLLTTGDAFTSAEGVDTDQAWPRRLERLLADQRSPQPVEVLNFAITGYGPDQYMRVVRDFAPVYRPDWIVVELYVNDFEDVLTTDAAFRASIRFDGRNPDGLRCIALLENLRTWCSARILNPTLSLLSGDADPNASFLRGVPYIERKNADWWTRGRDALAERMAQMKRSADAIGARLVILMVPAAIQVCSGEGLELFPSPVDLTDSKRFDPDLPQRLAQRIADDLGVRFVDLRRVFKPSMPGIYQRRNMHLTAFGHQLVADDVASVIIGESARLVPVNGR
jgi:peptidoglycan/LPS O-acetylase OafA/YrhL